jgi:hypothetical protein
MDFLIFFSHEENAIFFFFQMAIIFETDTNYYICFAKMRLWECRIRITIFCACRKLWIRKR